MHTKNQGLLGISNFLSIWCVFEVFLISCISRAKTSFRRYTNTYLHLLSTHYFFPGSSFENSLCPVYWDCLSIMLPKSHCRESMCTRLACRGALLLWASAQSGCAHDQSKDNHMDAGRERLMFRDYRWYHLELSEGHLRYYVGQASQSWSGCCGQKSSDLEGGRFSLSFGNLNATIV